MPYPIISSLTLAAAQTSGLAPSQSLSVAGSLSLSGVLVTSGVGTLTPPQRVGIKSNGNDSGITWTITGTAKPQYNGGATISETIAGSNGGTAQTTQDFATVTSIVGSGATASTVFAGTTGVASGPWVPWDQYQMDWYVSAAAHIVAGSPTYQLDVTWDDVFLQLLPPTQKFPLAYAWAGMVGQVGDQQTVINGNNGGPVAASRLTITAVGGSSCQMTLTQRQSGN